MTFTESNFLFLRNPGGGVENLAAMKAAGFAGVFCNLRDFSSPEWAIVRENARANGMFCGPWARVQRSDTFSEVMLGALIAIADQWRSPLIVNCEKELDGTGSTVTKRIAERVGARDVALSVEAWPFSTVDWKPVGHLPILPQIYPAESPASKDPAACKAEWHRVGARCVYFTYGTYAGMKPADFDLKAPYSLYTGDDMGSNYAAWSPTSSGFKGCVGELTLPSGPTTAETRDGIIDWAKDWETGQGGPRPLTRITTSRRICDATDVQWRQVNAEIVAALNRAGVGE